ncbi:MAG: tetratricopeptide repeat protein [Gemmatimonadetes bacterium]|nr:tetratricopeptide repeat protein [Gemmatimonadota bacterium]
MNKSDQRIRKFNPGTFLSDEEVIEQFVVRKHELSIALEVLRGNIDSPSCQHVLVVAPRGRGKTMLLARVAAELNTDDGLSECLLPVRFMEESHEVLNIADFWLETLFHLARESVRHDPVLAQELRETHADLRDRWREKELADRVFAAVLDASDRLGKKLVLMVENLQSIGENVDDDFGWQLRGALQSEPQIMLLATATSRFKGLDDAEQPFFEQFRILDLEPLNTEECRRLWQVVTGDEVSDHGIRPLEILTGGSPRLLVIVGEFAQHRSLGQLMEELVTLIDDHTEYFRSHLEVLASVERRVYLAVIDLWQPSNAGEIAVRARKDIRTVSTLLRRLANRGAVIVEGTGRKRMYVASERLYSIYYKLRRERDEAAVVANLIYFMAVFYSEAELVEMSDELIAEAARLPVIREGFERAIAEQPQVGSVFSNIVRPSIDQASDLATSIDNKSLEQLLEEINTAFNEEAFEKVIEIVDQAFAAWSANWPQVPEPLIAMGFLNKALAHGELGEFAAAISAYDEVIARLGDSDIPDLQERVAWALFRKGNVQRQLGEFAATVAAYNEVVVRFGDSDVPALQVLVAWALCDKGDTHEELGEFAAALSAYDELIKRFGDNDAPTLQEHVAWALCKKGDMQGRLGEFISAIATYDEVVARFGDSDALYLQERVAWTLCAKGDVQAQLDEFATALITYDEVIAHFDDSDAPALQVPVARALCGKGNMQVQLGELAAGVTIYDEVIARFGDSDIIDLQERVAWVLCKKGDVQSRLGEFTSAVACYDEVITRFGDSEALMLQERVAWAWSGKGDVQGRLGEFVAAISAYDEAVALLGDSDAPDHQVPVNWTLFKKGMRQIQMGRAKEALRTCEEIERRLDALTGNEKIEFSWRTKCLQVLALMVQKKRRAAVDMFRSAYAVFVPDNETIMHEMLHFVPELIAQGVSERDLIEILSSDKEKLDALVPLIVALLQRAGEVVRAPVEVLEVAKDINKDIDAKMAS